MIPTLCRWPLAAESEHVRVAFVFPLATILVHSPFQLSDVPFSLSVYAVVADKTAGDGFLTKNIPFSSTYPT